MRNKEAAIFLIEQCYKNRLNPCQKDQLLYFISDALTFDGGGIEMDVFKDILTVTPDESNWNVIYDWKIKEQKIWTIN